MPHARFGMLLGRARLCSHSVLQAKVFSEFVKELEDLDVTLAKKNEERKTLKKWTCLAYMPSMLGTSISI